jgi:hypothetical protein
VILAILMYINIRLLVSCDVTFCSLVGVTDDSVEPADFLQIQSAGSTETLESTVTNQKAAVSLPRNYFYLWYISIATFV